MNHNRVSPGPTDLMKLAARQLALGALVFLVPWAALARQGAPPSSRLLNARPLPNVAQLRVAATDPQAELAADLAGGVQTPLRYATPSQVQITPATHGTWENVPGGRLWRLRVASKGATDLSFGFSTCRLPHGATLHVLSEGEDYFQGPYESRDNKAHRQLWTPLLPGGDAVIELFVPAGANEQPELVLAQVNRGYRDMFKRQAQLDVAKAGACNNDVICPAGDAWRNEIRSVGVYSIGGTFLCTGTLINDVAGDFKNFFLTANHCGITAGNAPSLVVYWNFESPTCGLHGGGSLAQNQSGATFRMAKFDVDVTLIELEDVPDSSFNVFYSGWDRSGVAPAGTVGIHHPNTDEKSISFANSTLTTVNSCIGTGGSATHWNVVWNSGVTEPGSSGSGIWDPITHRLVGTLSGGGSACPTPSLADCYGKFSVAWNLGLTADTRLRDWLDPLNTSPAGVPGKDPSLVPILTGAGAVLVSENCAPTNGVIDPSETVTVKFALRNQGGSNTINLVATLLAGNGVSSPSAPQSYGVVIGGGASVTQSFTFSASGPCGSSIAPRLQLQDGTNNLGTVSFSFTLGATVAGFTQNFDGVTPPSLPAGWTVSGFGGPNWATVSDFSDTAPRAAYVDNSEFITDLSLTSPSLAISTTNARLGFRHRYDMEIGFDGGVLEISIAGGAFDDILNLGGTFISGAYTFILPTVYDNPLGDRAAWSGNSGGFTTTTIQLPASAAGQNVQFRWRIGTDDTVNADGWWVDSIALFDGYVCCLGVPLIVDTRQAGTNLVFSFDTAPGGSYVTEAKTLLFTNVPWVPVKTNLGNGSRQSVSNSLVAPAQRFFRVRKN